MKTALMLRDRATGKTVFSDLVDYSDQVLERERLYVEGSDEFDMAAICYLNNFARPQLTIRPAAAPSENNSTQKKKMNPFKNLRGKIAAAMLVATFLFTSGVRASDESIVVSNSAAIPRTLATTTGTNIASPYVFDVQRQRMLAIGVEFNTSEANSTSNVVYGFTPRLGITGPALTTGSNSTVYYSIPSTGTTVKRQGINIDTLGYPFWELTSISNTTGLGTWTNHGVYWNPLPLGTSK